MNIELPEARGQESPALALSALIDFGLRLEKQLGGRPAPIEVRDPPSATRSPRP